VLKKVDDATVHVKLNNSAKTNLLKTVRRPLGGNIALTYKPVGNRVRLNASPKIDMPGNQWVLASVTTDSGQAQSQGQPMLETFDYANRVSGDVVGFTDRAERENYGYADVTTRFPDEGTSIVRTFHNQDYYQKGLATSTTWNQGDVAGQALKQETFTYLDPSGKDPNAQPVRTGTVFPAIRDSDVIWFEADPAGRTKRHRDTKAFDLDGNLTDVADYGDVDFNDPNAQFSYHIDYVHPDTDRRITRASAITARTGLGAIGGSPGGALLRQRSATYSAAGKPLTMTDTIVGGKDPATGVARTEPSPALATFAFGYDVFGNVTTSVGPEGHALADEYDPLTHTYRTKTTDSSFGYVSTADYDLRFGTPKIVVDVDGAREETDYDEFGRVVRVFGPKDFSAAGARTSPSLTMTYSEQPHAPTSFTEVLPAWASTAAKNVAPPEMSRPGDAIPARPPIRSIAFVDGLQRLIQTKKDVSHDDGLGNVADGMSVSGQLRFDARGRLRQEGQPIFRPASADFVTDVPLRNPKTYAYDVLSRQRQEIRPDASSVDASTHGNVAVTTTSYQLGTFDGRLYLAKLVRDARGEVRSLFRTVREEVIGVDEVNKIRGVDNVHLVTRYAYDPLSQLLSVTDTRDNVTTVVYDTLGKMVELNTPDTGRTEWRHDRAGNATVKQPAALRARGRLINYVYNNDRLEAIDYPDSADVQYVYGAATETGAANGFVAGRVKRRVDESGRIDFTYDALGNVAKETSTLVSTLPSQKDGYATVMTYTYDSFGRMLEMQFPGISVEVLRYGYDAGGMVTSARGLDTVTKSPNKNPDTIYLRHVGYDEFGKRTHVLYGNGVETQYTHEADTRRLSQTNTDYTDKTGRLPMQRLRYAYDVMDNVRSLQNAVPTDNKVTPVAVGPTSYTYDYDRLYQLTHADGLYQTSPSKRFRHSLDYVYDEIGNITQKNQQDFQDQTGPNGIFQEGNVRPATTYKLDYRYDGTPHAVTHLDEARQGNLATSRDISHDPDGNQTGWTFQNGQQRVETWNEEDRLRQVEDQGHVLGFYLYNADGVRTHSVADGRELVYVNQYLTIRNNSPYITKNIYADDTRIASKLDGNSSPPPTTFWYHSDQLNSTQFTTTDDQSLSEHAEYFASGESWQEERTNLLANIRPEYLFNGKELDTLTGYYYYGARYYDPVVQNWQSADPMITSFVQGKPHEGVFRPQNLGAYSYTWNNPLNAIDPFGLDRFVIVVGDPGLHSHNQGNNFKRAGDTAARDLRRQGHTVDVVRASSTSEFNQAITTGPVIDGGVRYFGHSWPEALTIGETPELGSNLTVDPADLKQISNANLGPKATLELAACFSGMDGPKSIAQALANRLQRPVVASTTGTRFSPNKHKADPKMKYPPSKGPLYSVPGSRGKWVTFTPEKPKAPPPEDKQ
jgi:RHS repeat-associated protein